MLNNDTMDWQVAKAQADYSRDGEELIHQCCRENGVSEAQAIQFLSWADENLVKSPASKVQSPEAARVLAKLVQIFEILAKHPDFKHVYACGYNLNVPVIDDIFSHLTPADLAKRLGESRESVNKVVLHVQKVLGCKPRAGQRTNKARSNMSRARLNQLCVKES